MGTDIFEIDAAMVNGFKNVLEVVAMFFVAPMWKVSVIFEAKIQIFLKIFSLAYKSIPDQSQFY